MLIHSQIANTAPPAFEATRLNSIHSRKRSASASRSATRIVLMITFWLCTALFTSQAHAAKSPIYTSFLNNKAVGGYDVVTYFQGDQKPLKGKKKYRTKYQGASWYFVSQDNLAEFVADPEKYAPQFGGYCAYAIALGDTVKGSPLQYHISDDKLYLNINSKYKKIWLDDKASFIERGNNQWPNVLQ